MQKTRSSKLMFDGVLFQVHQNEMEIKGKNYRRDIVTHKSGGAGIVVIKDDQILLTKQYRPAISKDNIEVPAGCINIDEDPSISAIRELEEECGLTCDNILKIATIHPTPGYVNETIHLYYTDHIEPVKESKEMDEDEEIISFWMHLDEAMDHVQKGIITDAKTIIGIQYAYMHKNSPD